MRVSRLDFSMHVCPMRPFPLERLEWVEDGNGGRHGGCVALSVECQLSDPGNRVRIPPTLWFFSKFLAAN
jgi:hypothetical protein